jgi:hypothetical protein
VPGGEHERRHDARAERIEDLGAAKVGSGIVVRLVVPTAAISRFWRAIRI